MVQEYEVDATEELIVDGQILVDLEYSSTDDILVQKDDDSDPKQELIMDGQILDDKRYSSIDDTLVQEDDDIDATQELIADSQILVDMGHSPIDEALVQENDDTDAKPELFTDEQIPGSAEYKAGANGLKEASVHDQILVNMDSTNVDERLTLIDDEADTEDEIITHDQAAVSMESTSIDEALTKKDDVNAMDGTSSISTDGVEELVFTSNAVDPEETINQASKTPGDTFGHDKDDNITKKFDPSTSQSANDKFVRGLDDFHKLMEEVEPPDELDVGAGSSIQEVLVVQGAQIIKMRFQKGMKQVTKSVSQFKRKTIQGWDNMKNEGKKHEENVKKYYEDNNNLQFALVVIEKQKKNLLNAKKSIWSACINCFTKARVFLKDLDLLGSDGAEDLDKDFLDYRKVTINDEDLAEIRRKTMEKNSEQRGGIESDGSAAQDDTASGNGSFGRSTISDEMEERVRKQYQANLLKSSQTDSSDASDTKI